MSAIELNLLPDVKLEYIKTQRSRRLVFSIAFLVTVAAIALLVLLLGIDGLQKKHLSDLSHDINSEASQLQHKPNINQILTVQNQLESLTALHAQKPVAPYVFVYLGNLTPATVSINNFSIDFTKQSITIIGSADALSSINQYVDTLKAATYTSNGGSDSNPAFSDVVLSSFGLNGNTQDKNQAANYTISMTYDKNIFDYTQKINLSVSNQVTTHSGQPSTDLFQASPAPVNSTTQSSGGGH